MATLEDREPEPEHDPGVPVSDFLAYVDLDQPGGVEEAVDELVSCLESGYYLQWDAVVREEQGLELGGAP